MQKTNVFGLFQNGKKQKQMFSDFSKTGKAKTNVFESFPKREKQKTKVFRLFQNGKSKKQMFSDFSKTGKAKNKSFQTFPKQEK